MYSGTSVYNSCYFLSSEYSESVYLFSFFLWSVFDCGGSFYRDFLLFIERVIFDWVFEEFPYGLYSITCNYNSDDMWKSVPEKGTIFGVGYKM